MTQKNAEKVAHIPDSQVKQDISDTQREIDDYSDELQVLERNPIDNKVRIYMLGGRISHREAFIKKLNELLSCRTELKQINGGHHDNNIQIKNR